MLSMLISKSLTGGHMRILLNFTEGVLDTYFDFDTDIFGIP